MAEEETETKQEFTPDPAAVAAAKDISPEVTHEERIPETERPDESPAGLGKGVGLPPGSTGGRDTGMTP